MRPIDADALMQDVIAHSYPLTNAFSVGGVDDGMFVKGIQQVVDEQPTLDVAPVVHGEWIFEKGDGTTCVDGWICTNCKHGFHTNVPYFEGFNYCPNCGAKMKGENDESDC